ncbi:MAG: 23S rRNA (uridine(2552)-2'-O)-methyltransferase RlmE [Halofilum sp. (in: g-proteobacteria)]|nr:23S rRNA (uridine(2552)-2'-O)-methyltransferase RlmE [Halofilum sp. (in: g-proteobacteria)]
MARSSSSRRWLKEHRDDPYARRARREGYRGRAVYKLSELDEKYRLLRPGMRVVDLGAAPGSWSQYAARRVGARGRVIASDLLELEPIEGVEFVRGDFREDGVLEALRKALGGAGAHLVMSDMAPNMSGMDAIDQPASMALTELAHALAVEVLESDGTLLTKMFQGEGSDAFVRALRDDFSTVRVRKPAASRDRSREVYVVATGRRR